MQPTCLSFLRTIWSLRFGLAPKSGESLKKARFTDEQMVRILREADTMSVAAAAKKHGVPEAAIDVMNEITLRKY
jgi:hypothetical protein